VVDLDEFFGVTEVIILVDQPRVEFIGPDNLPELGARAQNAPLLDGVGARTCELRCGGDVLALWHFFVIDDVAGVTWISTIFTLPIVLSYPPTSIIVG
jgi:hypothetical protein